MYRVLSQAFAGSSAEVTILEGSTFGRFVKEIWICNTGSNATVSIALVQPGYAVDDSHLILHDYAINAATDRQIVFDDPIDLGIGGFISANASTATVAVTVIGR